MKSKNLSTSGSYSGPFNSDWELLQSYSCSLACGKWTDLQTEIPSTEMTFFALNVLKIHLVLTPVIRYWKLYLMPLETLATGEKLFKMPTNWLTRQRCVKKSQSSRASVHGLYFCLYKNVPCNELQTSLQRGRHANRLSSSDSCCEILTVEAWIYKTLFFMKEIFKSKVQTLFPSSQIQFADRNYPVLTRKIFKLLNRLCLQHIFKLPNSLNLAVLGGTEWFWTDKGTVNVYH